MCGEGSAACETCELLANEKICICGATYQDFKLLVDFVALRSFAYPLHLDHEEPQISIIAWGEGDSD